MYKCLYKYVLCVHLCACVCVHCHSVYNPVCVWLPLPFFPHLSWHANPRVKARDVSSGVRLWGDLSGGNIQVWDRYTLSASLSVGLTSRWKRSGLQTVDKATIMYDTRAQRAHVILRPDLGYIWNHLKSFLLHRSKRRANGMHNAEATQSHYTTVCFVAQATYVLAL